MSFIERKVKKILKENDIDFEEIEHEPVYTCEEGAEARGLDSPRKGVKSLIFKTDSDSYILVLNPGDEEVEEDRISKMEDVEDISLASPREVKKIAGVKVGSVPPFGTRKDLKTYLNEKLLDNDYLYFNPGSHEKSIKMKASDLEKVLNNPILF